MQSIFNATTREELINRINSLNANSKVQWGKINEEQIGYKVYKHINHHLRQFNS